MAKVSEAELKQINELRSNLVGIITTLGELSVSKLVAEDQIVEIDNQTTELQNKFRSFQQEERVLFEELQKKYGTGNIDLETGEITVE